MKKAAARSLLLRPADPFDLIRWLARSQSDPRKAVAELVQNSIDARARHVAVERRRLRGGPALVVRDDGEGVLPTLGREEALRFVATNIGASRKRNLTAEERRRLVITGQYGVGLLGFWSIGHRMEIRSRVAGSPVHGLRLVEDDPRVTLARAVSAQASADDARRAPRRSRESWPRSERGRAAQTSVSHRSARTNSITRPASTRLR